MNHSPHPAMGKVIIFVLSTSILLVLAVKFWPRHSGSSGRNNVGTTTRIPQEIQVSYLPANFTFALDDEDAIAIITQPLRYKKDFDRLVRDINLAILEHVSNRMNLPEDTRLQVRQKYQESHPYLRNLYYQDFISLRDSTSILAQRWYRKEANTATRLLQEVAAKYTCFLVNQIMATVLETEGGVFYGKGTKVETPCGIAIQEALNPMLKHLEASAAIHDFNLSKNLLEERIERDIIELATYELQSKKGLSKQLKTQLFGLNVSTSKLEISAVSVMKIGFDLSTYFAVSLNPDEQVVVVTLPPPRILSHAVYPNADKLQIGWMREVSEADLNRAFEALREEFVREARREGGFAKAQQHAQQVMELMLEPVITTFNPDYSIRVTFQKTSPLDPELKIDDVFSDLAN